MAHVHFYVRDRDVAGVVVDGEDFASGQYLGDRTQLREIFGYDGPKTLTERHLALLMHMALERTSDPSRTTLPINEIYEIRGWPREDREAVRKGIRRAFRGSNAGVYVERGFVYWGPGPLLNITFDDRERCRNFTRPDALDPRAGRALAARDIEYAAGASVVLLGRAASSIDALALLEHGSARCRHLTIRGLGYYCVENGRLVCFEASPSFRRSSVPVSRLMGWPQLARLDPNVALAALSVVEGSRPCRMHLVLTDEDPRVPRNIDLSVEKFIEIVTELREATSAASSAAQSSATRKEAALSSIREITRRALGDASSPKTQDERTIGKIEQSIARATARMQKGARLHLDSEADANAYVDYLLGRADPRWSAVFRRAVEAAKSLGAGSVEILAAFAEAKRRRPRRTR